MTALASNPAVKTYQGISTVDQSVMEFEFLQRLDIGGSEKKDIERVRLKGSFNEFVTYRLSANSTELAMYRRFHHEQGIIPTDAIIDLPEEGMARIFQPFCEGDGVMFSNDIIATDSAPEVMTHISTLARKIFFPLDRLAQERVVHCDIKPENILYSLGGEDFLLTDFGFSCGFPLIEQPVESYREILVAWTSSYICPEVAREYVEGSYEVEDYNRVTTPKRDVYAAAASVMAMAAVSGKLGALGDVIKASKIFYFCGRSDLMFRAGRIITNRSCTGPCYRQLVEAVAGLPHGTPCKDQIQAILPGLNPDPDERPSARDIVARLASLPS